MPESVRDLIARSAGDEIAPGHRFSLYFPSWKAGSWSIPDGVKRDGLESVTGSGAGLYGLARALVARQTACGKHLGEQLFSIDARNSSPFVTGLGMEHPVENGFAFLNPYGLPYLPGASVKGALRRAAESLALEEKEQDRRGWDLLAVWWLFGFDATAVMVRAPADNAAEPAREWARAEREEALERAARLPQDEFGRFAETVLAGKERHKAATARAFLERTADAAFTGGIHNRGALVFWDVIPVPAEGNGLGIDILTPHHSGYYRGDNSPHKSENPIPNPFLVLEPGARFRFHIEFRPTEKVTDGLRQHWQALVEAAFERLFEEAGFGAKTSVGYGVFERAREGDPTDTGLEEAKRWVEETAGKIARQHNMRSPRDAFRSRPFAENWRAIDDEGLRNRVRAYLEAEVWSDPLYKPSKKTMGIYNIGSEGAP